MADPDISVAMWLSVPQPKKHLANRLGAIGDNQLTGRLQFFVSRASPVRWVGGRISLSSSEEGFEVVARDSAQGFEHHPAATNAPRASVSLPLLCRGGVERPQNLDEALSERVGPSL